MIPIRFIVAISVAVTSLLAGADQIEFEPGLWKTEMTRTNPMTGQPVTETRTECVKESRFDPASMMQDTEGCSLLEDKLEGDTLNFRMECSVEGGQALIDGRFQTDGQTGRGNMDMTINAGGMKMSMNMNWSATRVGDC